MMVSGEGLPPTDDMGGLSEGDARCGGKVVPSAGGISYAISVGTLSDVMPLPPGHLRVL